MDINQDGHQDVVRYGTQQAGDLAGPHHHGCRRALEPGEILRSDEKLLSPSGEFAAVFHDSGTLSVYDLRNGPPLLMWPALVLERELVETWGCLSKREEFLIAGADMDVRIVLGTTAETGDPRTQELRYLKAFRVQPETSSIT